MLGWREIDFALISEASKIRPDFSKMEQLVRDGADVNAIDGDNEFYALAVIIKGGCRVSCYGDEDYCATSNDEAAETATLFAVIDFFMKHGFDPERCKGRVGARCLEYVAYRRCNDGTKISVMKRLLDLGFKDVAVDEDADGNAVEASRPIWFLHSGISEVFTSNCARLDDANVCAALYEMLLDKEEGRPYSGVNLWTAAYDKVLKRVFVTKPKSGPPFFDLNKSYSKHVNCFRGSLYFEFENGWLTSKEASVLVFDTERPRVEMVDVTDSFGSIVGMKLKSVLVRRELMMHLCNRYVQPIIWYDFSNDGVLITRTTHGEMSGEEPVAYYRDKLSSSEIEMVKALHAFDTEDSDDDIYV